MKEQYKIFKRHERRHRAATSQNRKTIDMLINLKSWQINIYTGETRRQLVYILNLQKMWDFDVRNWFINRYDEVFYSGPAPYKDHTGDRYEPKNRKVKKQEFPF